MRIYSARLLLASILLLTNIIPDMHALYNPPVEDIDALLDSDKRSRFIDSVDSAYVRHPLLCTIGFTIISFVMLYIANPEVRKRVRTLIGLDDLDDDVLCMKQEALHD